MFNDKNASLWEVIVLECVGDLELLSSCVLGTGHARTQIPFLGDIFSAEEVNCERQIE